MASANSSRKPAPSSAHKRQRMARALQSREDFILSDLHIGGLTPLTTTDYPGCLAAVVFCQGCPWRCGYCHNPHLLPRTSPAQLDWRAVCGFLERRRGLLDAVVFSGGEPTLQTALMDAARQVRGMGFKVGLHTAGMYPSRLKRMLPLFDWVGLDIKAPFEDYEKITGARGSGEKALVSARLVLESGIEHEFRTTVSPRLFSDENLLRLTHTLAEHGVQHFSLQECRPSGRDERLFLEDASDAYSRDLLYAKIGRLFSHFTLRRA